MANKIKLFSTTLIASLLFGANAFAQNALVHMQGKNGDREAYYITSWVMTDRTPMDQILGPITVKELSVDTIYESAQKPEMAHLNIQFECPSAFSRIEKGNKIKPLVLNGPVKFKLGAYSYVLPRENLKAPRNLADGQWQIANTPVLVKLRKYACNDQEIDKLFRDTIKKSEITKKFDIDYFRAGLTKLNISSDVILEPETVASGLIMNTWLHYWFDNEHPDPTGAWHTKASKEDVEKYKTQMANNQAKLNDLLKKANTELVPQIKEAQEKFSFRNAAAKVRGNRKMSKSEFQLIQVWEGKTEDDILQKYGNPYFANSGNTHILTYGKSYDNTALVTDLTTGATWETGDYASCDINFFTIPDPQGTFRIADVRVTAEENRTGNSRSVCRALYEVPN